MLTLHAFAATPSTRRRFDVPAGNAEEMLRVFAAQAEVELVYAVDTVEGVRMRPVKGEFAVRDALGWMVANTGLVVLADEKTGALMLRRPPPRPPATAPPRSSDQTKTTMKRKNPLSVLGAWLALGIAGQAAEPPADTGIVEGRVLNARSGEYLENARVTAEGSAAEALTDSGGYYRLAPVPAGNARLKVFFTGFEPLVQTVAVTAGGTAQHDFNLGASVSPDGTVVQLAEFVVGASREMSGAAIAINEQRFAPNMKNVVSTDEFGAIAEGNAAEFLKFLPGITIEYSGGDAREISINGVPPDNVPVTIDGFSLASGGNANTRRAVEVGFVALNNVSRIEVAYSPTPDSQGEALAGSINMVPRSSFERSKPVFNSSVYVLMRDNVRTFGKTPGPLQHPTRKINPGFDLSYILPVNDRFGLTFSAGYSKQYSDQAFAQKTWRGTSAATNGAAFPHTTPGAPYLSAFNVRDGAKDTSRESFGFTVDYKLTPRDRFALSFQYSSFDGWVSNRNLIFDVGRVLPGNFSLTSTRGAAGGGSLTLNNATRLRSNRTYMPTLTWRHAGPIWKAEAGVGLSRGENLYRDIDKGMFNNSSARRTGVTVSFDDIFYLRPRQITVADGTTGAPVDPYSLVNYALVSTASNASTAVDVKRTAYANARRDFLGAVPLTLKGGVDFRQTAHDLRINNVPFSFVGADGRASTTPAAGDDSAAPFLDASYSQRTAPYGFPQIQYTNNQGLWAFSQTNPSYFTIDENSRYRSAVNNSKYARELVSATYLRGDLAFLDRRLKVITGLRAEQTNVDAEGRRSDPTLNFQRDAAGNILRSSAGAPLLIVPTSNPLGIARLTMADRGTRVEKEYLRLFPSLNASYNLRENLIARGAFYESVGRPNYNQYAGGVTLPDLDLGPTPTNRIQVNNAAIKAWAARTVNVRLEYYFEGVGQISLGAFRRDFENFFDSTEVDATPEFLALYGLDPAIYGDFKVATQANIDGTVRTTGLDFSYKQALTFLPHWARGVQVFANASAQRVTGPGLGAFDRANIVPRSGSWGISLTRQKFNVRANWNYRGRHRRALVASGNSIEAGTYNWASKRMSLDVLGEFYLRKNIALFASFRNIGDEPDDFEIAGPNTPDVAQLRSREAFGSLWTFGVKGTF